jgi:hypothetical protein
MGLGIFSAHYTEKEPFLKLVHLMSVANIVICMLPVILVDVVALVLLKWGT